MNSLYALLLGVVQGVTEFLPISSSAHLKIIKHLLKISEDTETFDLSCHMGTCLVLIFYFRKHLFNIFFLNPKQLFLFLAALLPLIPMYIFLHPIRVFLLNTKFLGFCMVGTAIILFLTTKYTKPSKPNPITIKDAVYVGICQGFALTPGISRSAITITAGLCRGVTSLEAVSFSFLLSIPAIMGGVLLETFKIATITPPSFSITHCIIGFFASIITGSITIFFAIPLLQKGILSPFGWYCLIVGCLLSIFL